MPHGRIFLGSAVPLWYHRPMAMTLRLDAGLDRQVQELADAQGVSKQQLIVRATEEFVQRERRMTRTLANADRVIRDNAGLLDRLGQ